MKEARAYPKCAMIARFLLCWDHGTMPFLPFHDLILSGECTLSESSRRWLERQHKDPFVKQAKAAGYVSRAALKLKALHDKYRIFKPGMRVLDLGAAPGGWTQVAAACVKSSGKVIAMDCLPLAVSPDAATFIQGDFTEPEVFEAVLDAVGDHPVAVVMSDMAPNFSGQPSVDQPRSMHLVELAWETAQRVLMPGGVFLTKVFQGSGIDDFYRTLRPYFDKVRTVKPPASRTESREVYILATGFKPSA
jgi:23S rRNA (uridine2552-2'-O)-methyltransferase